MRLLSPALLDRFTPQPDRDERNPGSGRSPDAQNPYPRAADGPTPRPLVVRKVSDTDFPLLIDVCEERTLVVDAEIEDTVLVGELEGGGVDGAVRGLRHRPERETVEGRQHGELELYCVGGWGCVGCEMVIRPF